MKLAQSKVFYDDATHTYLYEGRLLSGVTSMLHRHVSAHKYDGISQMTLEIAALRGHLIHSGIQKYDIVGMIPNEADLEDVIENFRLEKGYPSDSMPNATEIIERVTDYAFLKHKANLQTEANEYLVSNYKRHASAIDIVMSEDGAIDLVDVKGTSKIDDDYLSWQLSIYKYLFELNNKGVKVRSLKCLWLPKPTYGKAKIKEVEEKPREEVERLIECDTRWLDLQESIDEKRKVMKFCEDLNDAEGAASAFAEIAELQKEQERCKYVPPTPTPTAETNENANPIVKKMEGRLIACLAEIKKAETMKKELVSRFLQMMQENNAKKWETDNLVITRVLGGTQKKFDSERFKEEQAELYEKYLKDVTVSESIRFKIK